MTRANYHWARSGDLHVTGPDPDQCPLCAEAAMTVLLAHATPPTPSQETA